MFLLQDIPTLNTLTLLKDRYPSFSPSAMRSCLLLLRTGSDLLVMAEKLFRKVGLSQGGFLILVVLNRDPKARAYPLGTIRKNRGHSGDDDRVVGYLGQGWTYTTASTSRRSSKVGCLTDG